MFCETLKCFSVFVCVFNGHGEDTLYEVGHTGSAPLCNLADTTRGAHRPSAFSSPSASCKALHRLAAAVVASEGRPLSVCLNETCTLIAASAVAPSVVQQGRALTLLLLLLLQHRNTKNKQDISEWQILLCANK